MASWHFLTWHFWSENRYLSVLHTSSSKAPIKTEMSTQEKKYPTILARILRGTNSWRIIPAPSCDLRANLFLSNIWVEFTPLWYLQLILALDSHQKSTAIPQLRARTCQMTPGPKPRGCIGCIPPSELIMALHVLGGIWWCRTNSMYTLHHSSPHVFDIPAPYIIFDTPIEVDILQLKTKLSEGSVSSSWLFWAEYCDLVWHFRPL